jgi:ribonuclease HI
MDPQLCGEIRLYTDGASRGNPGPAGAGIYITDATDQTLMEKSVFLGKTTNNVAEYQALIIGLELALQFSPQRLLVQMDSELIVRQLSGRYRVTSSHLLPLFRRARELLASFKEAHVAHIPREKNRQADRLSNQAIDQQD